MKAFALILSCLFVLNIPYAYSHGGGLDPSGCHTEYNTGSYHCHGNSSGGEDELSGGQVALVTIGLIGAIALMIWAATIAERPYALNEEDNQNSLAHSKKKQDIFSVSTNPLLIFQGEGLSLKLSF